MTLLAAALKGAGALVWLGYAWVLAQILPAEQLGPTLYALGLAGVSGGLACAGRSQLLLREGARHAPRGAGMGALFLGALGGTLRAAVLAGLVLVAAAQAGVLPLDTGTAAATALAAGLHALTGTLAAARRAQGAVVAVLLAQGPLRAGAPLIVTLAADGVMALSPAACLLCHAAGLILALLVLLRGLPRPRKGPQARLGAAMLWRAQAGWLLFSQLDLILCGLVLPPAEAAAYLIARRVAGLAALVFDALRLLHAPRLARGFHAGDGRAAAEACNLQFLWLGVAALAALLAAAPLLAAVFGPAATGAAAPFLWLVAVQATPALFGATGLALNMAGMERARLRLILWALGPAAIALLAAGTQGAAALAAATAGAHLLQGAAAARLLRRAHAIRPGIVLIRARAPGAIRSRCVSTPQAACAGSPPDPSMAPPPADRPHPSAPGRHS